MQKKLWLRTSLSLAILLAGSATMVGLADPPQANDAPAAADDSAAKAEQPKMSVTQARARAKLLHRVYSSTLDVIHHRYFRDDRATVPARALEEVFEQLAKEERIEAKWIVVNAKEMSIDHKPKTEFDRKAVKAISSGEETYEEVKEGWYRRAGAISLMNRGCLGCHLQFGSSAKKERFAGLVIEIPVKP